MCGREFWQRKYLYTPATCSSSCGQRYRKRGLLTARENEVLALIKDGLSNKDIAARLEISVGAVANVVSVVYHKLGVKDRAGAVEVARRQTAIRGATL